MEKAADIDYKQFVRQRICELRKQKNVSEYQMSLDMGQNKNYLQGISSGKALPSMTQFFHICAYFAVTPMQFFDGSALHPQLVSEAIEAMRGLSREDLLLVLGTIHRLRKNEHT